MIDSIRSGQIHKIWTDRAATDNANPLASHRAEQTRQMAIAQSKSHDAERYSRAIEAFRNLPTVPHETQRSAMSRVQRAYAEF